MTRVLIVAASAVVRAGLQTILAARPDLEIAGSTRGLASLAQEVEAARPDVVLVDVERGHDGPAPGRTVLAALGESTPLVVLTDMADGGLEEALRLGARSVLPRDASAEEIVAAVQAAAAGLLTLHLDGADALAPLLAASARVTPSTQTEPLTPREVEVLHMLAEGEGNKIIARRLGISEHTVKFHVGSILAKLHASSRTEAVTIGVRQGIIML
ncbi:MAG: response regulator transcription factor [Chloroflexi bacterium]|nr:response regulator transcription factor [Chloroflexota bacterium]